ncbi:MAG: VanZ family protein [Bacteroidota bacterium]
MNWIRNNQKIIWLCFICVVVGITALSLIPPISNVNLSEKDKLGHFIAYAVATFNGLLIQQFKSKKFIVVVMIILYSGFLELLQGFVPGREQSFWDLVANTAGVLSSIIILQCLGSFMTFKEKS